jgi:peptidoglycan hydrolase-like amidase
VHSWSTRVSDTLIEATWPGIGNLTRITVLRRDGHGEWGGRVASVRLVGGRGQVQVSGDTLRSVLGLRSTWVTFVVTHRG